MIHLIRTLLAIALLASAFSLHATDPERYDHGNPTDEEQLYLEFINQARASIDDEVARLANTTDPDVLSAIDEFNVDLALMADQFENLKSTGDDGAIPVPGNTQMPLAFNSKLIEASRLHSEDMFLNVFQGHTSSSNPVSPIEAADGLGERAAHVGYIFAGINENVYSSAKSVWHGHAAFNIDWGFDEGGMQDPPGHRWAIHHPDRREAGIGVVLGSRTDAERDGGVTVSGSSNFLSDVGPQVVTQVMAKQFHPETGMDVPFLTGVAYLDIDGNSFYSLNEGLGDVTIEVDGAEYYAVTSASGGYAIPLPNEAASYTLTVSGPGFDTFTDSITVAENLHNVKWDFSPAFTLPSPAGPVDVIAAATNTYTYDALPGSEAYAIRVSALDGSSWVEDASDPDGPYTISQSAGYDVRQTFSRNSGAHAFRLATVSDDAFTHQILELDRSILVGETSSLEFMSRRGYSTEDQIAYAEVSTDGGQNWTTVYSIMGFEEFDRDDDFTQQSISLADYAEQVIQVRFRYSFGGGGFYAADGTDTGWYVDDITVTDSFQLTESATVNVEDTEFGFNPPEAGDYLLESAGLNGESRVFPFGAPLQVTASGPGGSGGPLAHSISGTGVEPPPEPDTRILDLSGELDFGEIEVGQSADRTLTLANNGNDTLTVSGITFPTGFSGDWTSGDIAPDATREVTVTFTPDAAGSFSGNIVISSNQTDGEDSIPASGTGVDPEPDPEPDPDPDPEPEPDTRILALSGDLDFGEVEVGQSADRTLTLANNGNDTLTVSGITFPTGFSGDWTSGDIAPDATREVTVTFAPDAAGSFSGDITVTSNQTEGDDSIPASGTGVDPDPEPDPDPDPEVDAPVLTLGLPKDFAVRSGRRAFLAVEAESDTPMTFQWYRGEAGDTSQPVEGANANALTTPPVETTTRFWLRVSNEDGDTDTEAITITIKDPPPATAVDQSQTEIDLGYVVAFDLWQQFVPESDYLAAVGIVVLRQGAPGDLTIAIADSEGRPLMQRTVPQDEVRTTTHTLTVSLGLFVEPGETYLIVVREPPSGDTEENRYVWRAADGDPYPAGGSILALSDPGLAEVDFAFRTIGGAEQGEQIPLEGETSDQLPPGWRTSPWLGDYYGAHFDAQDHGWIFHREHGWWWFDSRPAAGHGFFIYDADLGWLWTRESLYPWLYSYQHGWIYYYKESREPRWFYHLADDDWLAY